MKILITNHHLKYYAGSEIYTLNIAKYFKSKGHNVTVATFLLEYPMKKHFREAGINAVEVLHLDKFEEYFDIAWCHHQSVFTHLLAIGGKAKKVIFYCLGHFTRLEEFPAYAKDASLLMCLSKEAKDHLHDLFDDHPRSLKEIHVLPNLVPDSYFIDYHNKLKKINKIAIISNHPPEEITIASDLLKNENIIVDLYSTCNKKPKLVTKKILLGYDAIITIGRTVQCCMALKIPVYIYDHFGGPGWLNITNFEQCMNYNFSGRGFNIKKSPETISSEILEMSDNLQNSRDELFQKAKEYFLMSKNIDIVLNNKINNDFSYGSFEQKACIQANKNYVQKLIRYYQFVKIIPQYDKTVQQVSHLNTQNNILLDEIKKLQQKISELESNEKYLISKIGKIYSLYIEKNT